MLSFQDIILKLQQYWGNLGCAVIQPYDIEVGAGTFHPATVLKCLGDETWNTVYVQPCRRPTDGRYGENPNRTQYYYQLQVILKPAPVDILNLYFKSLEHIGIDLRENDIKLLEDDWESPTLGASGLGWEVQCNGMEITQFTYFQKIGSISCSIIAGEITYGLERVASVVQGVDDHFKINWNGQDGDKKITYGDMFSQNEREFSAYNFEYSDTNILKQHFVDTEETFSKILDHGLVLPAYEMCLKASHLFNLLDARGVISVSERAQYIARVRNMARNACEKWLEQKNA